MSDWVEAGRGHGNRNSAVDLTGFVVSGGQSRMGDAFQALIVSFVHDVEFWHSSAASASFSEDDGLVSVLACSGTNSQR
jgi:hypothetical protein